MKVKLTICAALCGSFLALVASSTNAQILYSETFDDGQATTRWTAQAGKGFAMTTLAPAPMDTNFDQAPFPVDGVNDDFSGFAYDYSVAGVPSAPGSGGSTIGLKLQASMFSNALGGFSANPNGVNLNALSPTGNYSVKFQSWSSMVGTATGFPAGGSGTTMLSTFGILTSGTASETVLSSDGVFFAYTLDGNSSGDFRAYSVEDNNSYDGSAGEPHATYHAGGRNNTTGTLYTDALGSGRTVPASVSAAFPAQNMTGTLNTGTPAFQWVTHEIRKVGNLAEWYVNGFKLITVDMTSFSTPTLGGNLSFGHADTNFGSSTDPEAVDLMFTLIDNIEVTAIADVVEEDADFDDDDDVDGRDFLMWQRGFGVPDALNVDGDADGDEDVDGDDLIIWQAQYGEPVPPLSAVTSVPEPASFSLFGALLAMFGLRRPAFGFARSR
jgi:hypothetical protein